MTFPYITKNDKWEINRKKFFDGNIVREEEIANLRMETTATWKKLPSSTLSAMDRTANQAGLPDPSETTNQGHTVGKIPIHTYRALLPASIRPPINSSSY